MAYDVLSHVDIFLTKGRAEVTGSQSVSAKRAMKFARTFSETIDEDDDGPLSGV